MDSTYSECVSVPLFIQRTTRMRHIIIIVFCDLCGCNIYFAYYHINVTILEKETLMNIKCLCVCLCVLYSLHRFSETFLIQRRTERDVVKSVYGYSRKVPVLFRF